MKAILSVSPDWGIADIHGNLLYRDKQDMKLFRGLTYNTMILAGHNTAASIPGGLRGRECFCISDDPPKGWKKFRRVIDENTWLIGGAKTIDLFLTRIDEFWLSRFHASVSDAHVLLTSSTIDCINSSKRVTVCEFDTFVLERFIVR